jgi:hypothetical protein
MLRRTWKPSVLTVAAGLMLAACGGKDLPEIPEDMFANDMLVNSLTNEVGLDTAQAAGGLGVILEYAKSQLPASDYASLSRLLPNSDEYLNVARSAELLVEPIGNSDALYDALDELDIGGGTAEDVVAEVGDYLQRVSGPAAQGAFSRLF